MSEKKETPALAEVKELRVETHTDIVNACLKAGWRLLDVKPYPYKGAIFAYLLFK